MKTIFFSSIILLTGMTLYAQASTVTEFIVNNEDDTDLFTNSELSEEDRSQAILQHIISLKYRQITEEIEDRAVIGTGLGIFCGVAIVGICYATSLSASLGLAFPILIVIALVVVPILTEILAICTAPSLQKSSFFRRDQSAHYQTTSIKSPSPHRLNTRAC